MSCRLVPVPKSVTLNDLERCNGPYFALFYRIWQSHNYGQFTIAMSISKRCRRTARRPSISSRFINSRLNAQYLSSYRLNRKSYELSIGTKIGDLEWHWTGKWPLLCVILPNLVVSEAHCVKVVDKTINMDNIDDYYVNEWMKMRGF